MSTDIGSAIQRGDVAYVYDARGRTLFTLQSDGIIGYTQSTISVRRGDFIFTHDSRGRHVSTR